MPLRCGYDAIQIACVGFLTLKPRHHKIVRISAENRQKIIKENENKKRLVLVP